MSRESKPSGVEWSETIPYIWNIQKLKYAIRGIKDGEHGSVERKGTGKLYLSAKNIGDNKLIISDNESLISEEDSNRITRNGFPHKGDVLFCCVGSIGKCCIYPYDYPIAFQRSVAFIQPNNRLNSSYIRYCLISDFCTQQIVNSINKSTIGGLYLNDIKELLIPFPPTEEIYSIVSFLDRKCSAIDTAIEKTKKSIEKLEEYKKAVITKTVTKGLDPNAKVKDSGVAWIGDIPEAWKTLRIKHSSWLKGRIGWDGLKSEEFIDDGPYLITGTDFNDGIVNWDTCVHITEDRYNEDKLLHVYNGDLLITKDGTVGKLAIITNAPDKVSLNSGVMIIRNNSKFKYDQQYMFYVLKSDVFTKWFDHHKKPGSTIQHLYQHQFDDFRYPFPSLAEQKNIAAYLEEKCMAIDALIVKKQEAINKWEEYKKSLVYYAVTGKIDCRNEVIE